MSNAEGYRHTKATVNAIITRTIAELNDVVSDGEYPVGFHGYIEDISNGLVDELSTFNFYADKIMGVNNG